MLGSVVLDVAIGMAFVYLLMSLIASVIQEILATFMQLRSANLQKAMRSLLSGNSIGPGLDLVESIYDHGLVRGLYSDPERDMNPDTVQRKAQAKDQSRAARFRRLVGKLSRVDWLRKLLRRLIGIAPEKEITVVSNQMLLPAYIPSRTFVLAMVDLLNRNVAKGADAMGADEMAGIREFLRSHQSQFPDNKATEAMLTLASDAQGDLKKFQDNLESWYNAAMDRASGWYKKYTQTILLGIGLVLAVLFNVDSVRVARTLWSDRDARQAMVNAASDYAKDHPATTAASGSASDSSSGSASDSSTGSASDSSSGSSAADLKAKLETTAQNFEDATASALLPVGWKHPFEANWSFFKSDKKTAIMLALGLLPGWLITALAISLGAPFWFDTLNQFMVVRSTIKPEEKSKPEASKS